MERYFELAVNICPIIYSNGLAAIMGRCPDDSIMYGYIDETGAWAIEPQFDEAEKFDENGLARVRSNGKWGLIDKTGSWVVDPKFDIIEDFDKNGLARVEIRRKYGFIDRTGAWAIKPEYGYAEDFDQFGLAHIYYSFIPFERWWWFDRCGCIDKNNKRVIKPIFESIGAFSKNGLAPARKLGIIKQKYGYIDTTGAWVIKPQFDLAKDFNDNDLAYVEVKSGCGLIDENGSYVLKPEFKSISTKDFDDHDTARIKDKNDKVGFIDITGKIIIDPRFDFAFFFDESGLAKVEVNGKYGYIDINGNYAAEPVFDLAPWHFGEDDLAPVSLNDKCGYINKQG